MTSFVGTREEWEARQAQAMEAIRQAARREASLGMKVEGSYSRSGPDISLESLTEGILRRQRRIRQEYSQSLIPASAGTHSYSGDIGGMKVSACVGSPFRNKPVPHWVDEPSIVEPGDYRGVTPEAASYLRERMSADPRAKTIEVPDPSPFGGGGMVFEVRRAANGLVTWNVAVSSDRYGQAASDEVDFHDHPRLERPRLPDSLPDFD